MCILMFIPLFLIAAITERVEHCEADKQNSGIPSANGFNRSKATKKARR